MKIDQRPAGIIALEIRHGMEGGEREKEDKDDCIFPLLFGGNGFFVVLMPFLPRNVALELKRGGGMRPKGTTRGGEGQE